jgi:hypothetical protein
MRPAGGFSGLLAALATAGGLGLFPVGGSLTATAAQAIQQARPLPGFGNPDGHADVPAAGRAVNTSHPTQVIGTGTPGSCTSAAVVGAVAKGGIIAFDCGPRPVTITLAVPAKVMNTAHQIVLDGGGLVTLSGGGTHQILYMNTCDPRQVIITNDCYDQQWPQLIVQNITLSNGYSAVQQTPRTYFGGGGGGAIFDLGGQLKVVNSKFTGNRCYKAGPDLGGGAIRALSQYRNRPVYIVKDTFSGGICSNGGALSSIGVSWDVINSVMTGNAAIGRGANPPRPGTRGGGSGGAIYTDGHNYDVTVTGSAIHDNRAREGGGAIFFVVNNKQGTLTIKNSALRHNPSGVFWTRPYPGIYFHSGGHPILSNSTIS